VNIVLIGFMGTGKSAVGHALADMMRARFLDTDAEIEREAEIFAEKGEEAFRNSESMLLQRLTHDKGNLVLSTGGGTPLRAENVRLLKKIGPIVWLTAPPQTILGRVRRNLAQRPLLANHGDDPLARVQHLLAERTPRYAAVADYEFDTSNFATSDAVATCILTMLKSPVGVR
jgi:shikimate kinase